MTQIDFRCLVLSHSCETEVLSPVAQNGNSFDQSINANSASGLVADRGLLLSQGYDCISSFHQRCFYMNFFGFWSTFLPCEVRGFWLITLSKSFRIISPVYYRGLSLTHAPVLLSRFFCASSLNISSSWSRSSAGTGDDYIWSLHQSKFPSRSLSVGHENFITL